MADQAKRAGFIPSIDLLIPHVPGIRFRATWHFINSGDTVWDELYSFAFSAAPHPETAGLSNLPLGVTASYRLGEIGSAEVVAPGEEIELTLPLVAPKEPGVYATQWQLQNGKGEYFGPVRWLRLIIADGALAFRELNAALSISELASPGSAFAASWRIENKGLIPWTEDYQLIYVDAGIPDTSAATPHPMSVQDGYTLAEVASHTPVMPGESVTIQLPMIAPQQPGDYASHWQMAAPNGRPFGAVGWAAIQVGSPRTTLYIGMNVGHFEETWRPAELDAIKELLAPFPIIRFMDWQKTNKLFNKYERPADYAPAQSLTETNRPRPDDDWRYAGSGSWENFAGMPLELIIDTANSVEARPWICVPHLATDELQDEMIRYVLTHAVRRPIFEYSNEVWNSGFKQFYDCAAMGASIADKAHLEKLGINLSGFAPVAEMERAMQRGQAMVWQAERTRYLAYRLHIIAQELNQTARRAEYGADVVVSAQFAVPWSSQFLLKICGNDIDAIAVAPYAGNRLHSADSEGEVMMALLGEIGDIDAEDGGGAFTVVSRIRDHLAYAGRYGLPLWGYEGGLHLRGAQFADFNRSQTAGQVLTRLLDVWFTLGGGEVCLYSLASRFGEEQFGHVELIENGEETIFKPTPKYRRLLSLENG